MKISVVAPIYRSAPYIEELHRRCVAAIKATGATEHEIILVNDASPDNGLEIAKELASKFPGVVVIDLSRNFGQHKAIMTGLAAATGDYVFVMDSDLEEEPEWITSFYRELCARQCDVVYGMQELKRRGPLYRFCRWAFYRAMNVVSSVEFPHNIVTARLMTRRYVDALLQFDEREIWIAGLWHMTGYTQLAVGVDKRDSSPTTYNLPRLLNTFVNAITAFSTRPLAIISVFGIGLSIVAFGFTAWVIYRKFADGIAVAGWASVMAAVLLIGGMSLFFNGIMAIYIAKIFLEVKQRPRTIVREVITSTSVSKSAKTPAP
jgi:putative glycosyltransferase